MTDAQPSDHAMQVAREPCEWEQVMWAVLWDTQPDNAPRLRNLCMYFTEDGACSDIPALFRTKREAQAYIRRRFDYLHWQRYRGRPMNNRFPKPYRVRVRITVPQEGGDG